MKQAKVREGRAGAAGFELVSKGNPAATATIVTAAHPTAAARLAAVELRYHIHKITGVVLSIRTEETPGEGNRILVGESGLTRAAGWGSGGVAPPEYVI